MMMMMILLLLSCAANVLQGIRHEKSVAACVVSLLESLLIATYGT